MPSSPKLRLLTLNVWGLKFISPDRPARLTAIIDHIRDCLGDEAYDVVCLQELWIYADFERVREGLKEILHESKFFRRCVSLLLCGVPLSLPGGPFLRATINVCERNQARDTLLRYNGIYMFMPIRFDPFHPVSSSRLINISRDEEAESALYSFSSAVFPGATPASVSRLHLFAPSRLDICPPCPMTGLTPPTQRCAGLGSRHLFTFPNHLHPYPSLCLVWLALACDCWRFLREQGCWECRPAAPGFGRG